MKNYSDEGATCARNAILNRFRHFAKKYTEKKNVKGFYFYLFN